MLAKVKAKNKATEKHSKSKGLGKIKMG